MRAGLKNWGKAFFRKELFSPGEKSARAAAPAEAAFIARRLGLKRRQKVLDLCCGTGRHSKILARKGFSVIGVDATAAYLSEARRGAGENPRFLKGDMRLLRFNEEFDAAFNAWTSFGYFVKESDDGKVLRGVFRALKPGGLFLIDLASGDWLERNFQARRWDRRGDGGWLLRDTRWLPGKDRSLMDEWTVLRPGRKPISAKLFLRNYGRARLEKALRRAGLKPIKVWGGLDGRPYRKDSPRLVVLARKPA